LLDLVNLKDLVFMFSQRFLGNEVISANAEIGVCFLQVSFGNLSDLLVRR
jgi:hypothetical protein